MSACISNITQPDASTPASGRITASSASAGELEPQRGQQPQHQRSDSADRERPEREQDGELDHGVSR